MRNSPRHPAASLPLYLHGLACLAVLKEKVADLKVTAAAGLSLGEFTAHAAAGTFSFEDGLNVVAQRGQFMEEACESTEGSMRCHDRW